MPSVPRSQTILPGFTEGGELPPLIDTSEEAETEPLPELTADLEEILSAIRELAVTSPYGTAADFAIQEAVPQGVYSLRSTARPGPPRPHHARYEGR